MCTSLPIANIFIFATLGAFTLSSKHTKKCQTGAWPRCYQGQLRFTARNAKPETFPNEVWSFGVFGKYERSQL